MYNSLDFKNYSFSGHESFPLRYSWLKKGYDALLNDSGFFRTPDAMVILGTGKNMVIAIRHWGLACRIWEEVPDSQGRDLQPTEVGGRIFSDEGWDPYLEEIGTIWLLHWLLVTNLNRATSWTWLFGRPKGNRFIKNELVSELQDLAKQSKRPPPRTTLKKDVDVLVRSYLRSRSTKGAIREEALDSPFVALGLISTSIERGVYEVVQGPHPTLPLPIFEFALVEYCKCIRQKQAKAVSLDELLYAPLSPGRTFRLSEYALVDRLQELVQLYTEQYSFDETAGLRQLLIHHSLPNPIDILDEFFKGQCPLEIK